MVVPGGGERGSWVHGSCILSVDAAGSGVQTFTWPYGDSEAGLCCVEPFLKTKQTGKKKKNLVIRNAPDAHATVIYL